MSVDGYLAFCLASIALAVVPGPTVSVIIASALRHAGAGHLIWLGIG